MPRAKSRQLPRPKVYTAGNKVSHKGIIYQAKWWTQGNEPGKGAMLFR